jgi:hypothetical protein
MTRHMSARLAVATCLGLVALLGPVRAEMTEAEKKACIAKFHIDPKASDSRGWHEPAAGSCKVVVRAGGHRFPDPACTPGALNPTVDADVLSDPAFKTDCVRDMATSVEDKKKVFAWYGLREDDTCEMDHFVSLEIGGADTLDNIWPECGPAGATGMARDFKQKDSVELYLGEQVKLGPAKGGMSQQDARQRVIRDWTALIDAAKKAEAEATSKPAN